MDSSQKGDTVDAWKRVFRRGFAPLLSVEALTALETALVNDDPRLEQGATTTPPPMQCVSDWPCEGACLFAYPGWIGDGLETVAEVEEAFARLCFDVDQRLQEPAICRHLMSWFDDTLRDEMRANLLPEVRAEIARRAETRVAG